MKCEEVVEWMHRYLDHDLGEAETAQMLQHVAICPECAEKFSLLRTLSRDLEDLPQVTPKFSLVDAIMPQLDAIDEARKEQSSTIQEMSPVPAAFENLQRSSERKQKQKWLNSMSGRMSMGAAAAVVVLGFAIWGYRPVEIENAESMMNSGSTQESAKIDQNLRSREINNEESSPVQSGISGLTDNIENQPVEEEIPETDPVEIGTEQITEPKLEGNPTPKQPTVESKVNNSESPKDSSSNSSRTESSKNLDQSQDSGSAAISSPESNENGATHTDNEKSESFASQGELPDGKEEDRTDGMTTPDPEIGIESSDAIRGLAGPEQGISSILTSKEWKSPDGSYLVMLIGNQLSIYSKPANDPDVLNLIEQRDLEGTLKSANWSKDGTVFNYETDKDGTVVKKSFNVTSTSGSGTSAK